MVYQFLQKNANILDTQAIVKLHFDRIVDATYTKSNRNKYFFRLASVACAVIQAISRMKFEYSSRLESTVVLICY